jgi:hypothetical protein
VEDTEENRLAKEEVRFGGLKRRPVRHFHGVPQNGRGHSLRNGIGEIIHIETTSNTMSRRNKAQTTEIVGVDQGQDD